jgi:hypothetical protein
MRGGPRDQAARRRGHLNRGCRGLRGKRRRSAHRASCLEGSTTSCYSEACTPGGILTASHLPPERFRDPVNTPLQDVTANPLLRRVLIGVLTVYGAICLSTPGVFRLPDAINLAIHETGHLIFLPFGEFMHFLGGTLFQIAFPLLFVAHFARRGDRFAAFVCCWWVAQSLWNVSVYMADARAQMLPLVGGGEHDWEYLLGTLNLLEHDLLLSRTVSVAGILIFAWAMLQAWFEVERPTERVAATATVSAVVTD